MQGAANQPKAVGTIPAGGTITYTFRYYLAQEMESNNPAFSVMRATGENGRLTVAADNADPAQSVVTQATAFLWDCEGGLPTWKNSVTEELAPDVLVEK